MSGVIEMIRGRKAHVSKFFDIFCETMAELSHKPLSEGNLVESLYRNLLPEIHYKIDNAYAD